MSIRPLANTSDHARSHTPARIVGTADDACPGNVDCLTTGLASRKVGARLAGFAFGTSNRLARAGMAW
jgi:hypothetical protein